MRILTGLSNYVLSFASAVRTAHLVGRKTLDGSRRRILGFCATRSLMRSPPLARNLVSVQPPPDGQSVLTRSTPSLQDNALQAANQDPKTKRQRRLWSEDELRIMEECDAKGMTARAIANCLEGRTILSIQNKITSQCRGEQNSRKQGDWTWSTADKRTYTGIANMQTRIRGGDADRQFAAVRWSADEKALVRDLQARGLKLRDICARFPDRSYTAVHSAVMRYGQSVAQTTSKTCRPWTSDEKSYLIKTASRGVGSVEISKAMGRTREAISRQACNMRITS